MDQVDFFDEQEALRRRNESMNAVAQKAADYPSNAVAIIARLSGEVTGEDCRLAVTLVLGKPHHHNVWGSVIAHAVRRGVIEATGEHVNMRTPKSHARKTPVYRVVGDEYEQRDD